MKIKQWWIFEIGAWVTAIVVTIGAVATVMGLAKHENTGVPMAIPQIARTSQALGRSDYERLKTIVQPFAGATQIEVGDHSITVSHGNIASHDEWQLAVAHIMGAAPLAQWEVEKLCAGIKCPDRPYAVTLVATVGQWNLK